VNEWSDDLLYNCFCCMLLCNKSCIYSIQFQCTNDIITIAKITNIAAIKFNSEFRTVMLSRGHATQRNLFVIGHGNQCEMNLIRIYLNWAMWLRDDSLTLSIVLKNRFTYQVIGLLYNNLLIWIWLLLSLELETILMVDYSGYRPYHCYRRQAWATLINMIIECCFGWFS
jgi:hypothetical protein